jgi:hypothetical protein
VGEALKTFFSPALVRRISGAIADTEPRFPVKAFIRDACEGLDDLELLARGHHIAKALRAHVNAQHRSNGIRRPQRR